MNPKQIIITGAMACAIALSNGVLTVEANACIVKQSDSTKAKKTGQSSEKENINKQDHFLRTLGTSSDAEIYDALYQGQSLADIASGNQLDVQHVIDYQVAELEEQLNQRLATGGITPEIYQAQKSELVDIVTQSVYSKMMV